MFELFGIAWFVSGVWLYAWDENTNYKHIEDPLSWTLYLGSGFLGPFVLISIWQCAHEKIFDNIRKRPHPWKETTE